MTQIGIGSDNLDAVTTQRAADFVQAGSPAWAPLHLKHPDLAHVRKWRVRDFDNHLVFYTPRTEGVSIVRVLHAASDWWTLLGLED